MTSRVEEPWTTEPSVYGPFGTLLHGLSAWSAVTRCAQGVWVWQVLVVLVVARRAGLLRAGARPDDLHGRVDVLWTLNPLVRRPRGARCPHRRRRGGPRVAAVVAVAWRPGWGGAALGGGGRRRSPARRRSPYAVVAVAVVAAWWVVGRRGGGAGPAGGGARRWRSSRSRGGCTCGPGRTCYDQLLRSRQAVSLAMPWRPLLEWGRDAGRQRPDPGSRSAWRRRARGVLAAAPAPGPDLPRLSRPIPGGSTAPESIRGEAEPSGAQPDAPRGRRGAVGHRVPGAGLLARRALLAAVVRPARLVRAAGGAAGAASTSSPSSGSTALALAYVPGRVLGMTPAVEDLTLGVRRGVVPWVGLVLWVVVIAAGVRRGSWPRLGPRRAARTTDHRHDERHGEGRADGRDRDARVVDEEADRQGR